MSFLGYAEVQIKNFYKSLIVAFLILGVTEACVSQIVRSIMGELGVSQVPPVRTVYMVSAPMPVAKRNKYHISYRKKRPIKYRIKAIQFLEMVSAI